MYQPELNFDGKDLRDSGCREVADRNREWMEWAREMILNYLDFIGPATITADDLRQWAKDINNEPAEPNCYGAVFRALVGRKLIEPCGWKHSEVDTNHGRAIRVYRLRGTK